MNLDTGKKLSLTECWVDEKNASLTELKATCKDFLLSGPFCLEENNHAFNETEAGYQMSSCYVYVVENNASLMEAGFLRGIPSTCMLMKIMCRLYRGWNDERIRALLEAG